MGPFWDPCWVHFGVHLGGLACEAVMLRTSNVAKNGKRVEIKVLLNTSEAMHREADSSNDRHPSAQTHRHVEAQ